MAALLKQLRFMALFLGLLASAAAQDCQYNSFLDALGGGIFGDTSIFKTAVNLAGYGVRIDFKFPKDQMFFNA